MLVVLMVTSWAALLLALYFGMYLVSSLWVLVLAVEWGLGLAAFLLTITTALFLRRRPRVVTAVLVAGVTVGMTGLLVDWPALFRDTWLPLHRGTFAELAMGIERGDYDAAFREDGDAALPSAVAGIAVDGRAQMVGTCDGEPVVLVSQRNGIPDGAIGYVYVPCAQPFPSDSTWLYANGDFIHPTIHFGDKWWWASDVAGGP